MEELCWCVNERAVDNCGDLLQGKETLYKKHCGGLSGDYMGLLEGHTDIIFPFNGSKRELDLTAG